MRFNFASALVVALAAESAVASTWFGKAAYNKWHETELERWLSDHDVPYPTPADRKDLENLVKDNWNAKVAQPYNSWDTQQLQSYLGSKGQQAKKGAEQDKDSLVASVKAYWHETEDQASNAYNSVKDWIFDSWTDSQLKAFLDRHGIPSPEPRTRDTLLRSARENYQTAANKVGETAAYPGNWLYESWSESELKAWLDERGYPAPQPSTRDKLIASIRRNSRLASDAMKAAQESASSSAATAQQSLTDALLDAWSDSQIKEWLDKNGVKVPQGSKRNELTALARKHRAKLTGDNAKHSVTSAYGAATSRAGNQYAQATDDASLKANQAYGAAGYYIDWIKSKLGLAASDAYASANSAASAASSSASSASSQASKSGKKSAAAATDAAAESASIAKHKAEEAAQQATDRIKEEL
ncbi:putative stress-responsive protein ish1 protein [Neofusicoccum parvum UCRNP2]|uniref:Putative stress-responsive protein ish1 protein n=1 Tax=Botryosphaeria parva (strain UCR-NP2) TaxID=1287680 RepID=R1EQR6_BOTPV|nr:putative stress-responsive protein ish1 protein [Neofusicoccum parvum UCRNP2]